MASTCAPDASSLSKRSAIGLNTSLAPLRFRVHLLTIAIVASLSLPIVSQTDYTSSFPIMPICFAHSTAFYNIYSFCLFSNNISSISFSDL